MDNNHMNDFIKHNFFLYIYLVFSVGVLSAKDILGGVLLLDAPVL